MRNDFESNYLMHHGILGQKWGHKNGPPYPLDAGDHSASEKKAGYKKSISGDGKESSKKAIKKQQKQFAKQMKDASKRDTPSWSNDEKKKLINNAISKEQRKDLEDSFKEWEKAFDKEEAFWSSEEYEKAHDAAYDDTLKWYKQNEPEQLDYWIKNNDGKTTGLAAYHDFRKMFEGYDDEYISKAQVKYFKDHNIDPNAERGAFTKWQSKVDDITDQLVGKYGKMPLDNKYVNVGYDTIRKYTRSGVVSLSRKYK